MDSRPYVRSAVIRQDTVLRFGGDAGWEGMTWGADDRQFAVACDGAGLAVLPRDHFFNSRVFAIGGADPESATWQDLPGYPDIPLGDIYSRAAPPMHYGFALLSVDGVIYQYFSTSTIHPFTEDLKVVRGFHLNAVKLIYSPNHGRTWHNQDGSTPVVRESYQHQTRETMVFLQEDQDAFSILSFLQMGKDYRDNRDGYVYVYAPNGSVDGVMNELVMFRVPRGEIRERYAYEYFARARADGTAEWVKDIDARGVVHTFPRGWMPPNFSLSWRPSVAYNAPLGVYIMLNTGGGDPEGADKTVPYFGLWIADHPWGPWEQIHEGRGNGGIIAPKWIAEDGRSFWRVFTDTEFRTETADPPTEETLIASMRSVKEEESFRGRLKWRQYHPYFGFNAERIDLSLA